jgi:hypothetical protein
MQQPLSPENTLDRKFSVMNHTVPSYLFAACSLLGIPGCLAKAAESDFQWLVRSRPEIGLMEGQARMDHEASGRESTKSRLRALQAKTVLSLVWVASAAVVG